MTAASAFGRCCGWLAWLAIAHSSLGACAEVLRSSLFRDEELNVRPTAERHAACSFTVLDADAEDFDKTLEALIDEKPLMIKNLLRKWTAFDSWTSDWYAPFVNGVKHGSNGGRAHPGIRVVPWNISDPDSPMCPNCGWSKGHDIYEVPADKYFEHWDAQGLGLSDGSRPIPNALVFDALFDCANDAYLEREAPVPDVFGGQRCTQRHVAFQALRTGHGLHRHATAWQAQVAGNKSWYLFPRQVGGYNWETTSDAFNSGFPHEEQPRRSGTMCGYQPVRDIYKDNLQFCVQGPGEVVTVPKFWWHSTCTLDNFNVATGGGLDFFKHEKTHDMNYWKARTPRIPIGFFATGTPMPQLSIRPPERGTMQPMGSAEALLEGVLKRIPPSTGAPGVELVFQAIDSYCWDEQWMFSLGDVKGSIVDGVVAEWVLGRASGQPVRGVEYGSFVGYSAMRVARHLPKGSEFTCVEPNYHSESFRNVVDKILSLADMDKVVTFRPDYSDHAIDTFAAAKAVFDIVTTDHMKNDYLPTLQRMISLGQLRTGGLFLADHVVVFNQIDLLKYLRFSGDFVDYRLYYAPIEYDDFHGQLNAQGDYHPDGVVSAVYVGPGRGQKFESPGQSVCSRFLDCSACLANLCGWCGGGGSSVCVPDELVGGGGCPSQGHTMISLSSGDMKCHNSILLPMAWVGPEDTSGKLRWHRVPGGRVNESVYDALTPQGDTILVEVFNIGPVGSGEVEVFWKPSDRAPMPRGTLVPLAGSAHQAYEGSTFITRCAHLDRNESWTVRKKDKQWSLSQKQFTVLIKAECPGSGLTAESDEATAVGNKVTAESDWVSVLQRRIHQKFRQGHIGQRPGRQSDEF
jgi:catechol O-methyltransferase